MSLASDSTFPSLSSLLSYVLLAFFGFLFFKLIILPLWKLSFYKRQGIPFYFFPMLGLTRRDRFYQNHKNDIFGYYKELSKTNPNARAFAGNIGSRINLAILDPKLLKEFHNHPSYYMKSQAFKLIPALLGTGLFLAEGDLWKSHRKTISGVFNFDFLKETVPLIVSTAREFLGKLEQTAPQSICVITEIQKITGEIVGRIFFSENLNRFTLDGQPITLVLAGLANRIGTVFRSPGFMILFITGLNLEWSSVYRGFVKEIQEFRKYCVKIIEERKASKVKTRDLLGLLLEKQDPKYGEDRFSDEDIVNEFITFFFAGMDTTGHLVNMTLYLLQKNPQYLRRVEEEIRQRYDSKGDTMNIDKLNKMEFMHSVIKETLRMYNPTSTLFPRIAQVDHYLGHIKVKKGTVVRAASVFNAYNSKYFEEPEKFNPDRWLDKKEKELDPYVYLPFSAGPRNCIGQHLAVITGKVILSEFIQRFQFRVEPEDFKLRMTFTSLYEPKERIMMRIERKQ